MDSETLQKPPRKLKSQNYYSNKVAVRVPTLTYNVRVLFADVRCEWPISYWFFFCLLFVDLAIYFAAERSELGCEASQQRYCAVLLLWQEQVRGASPLVARFVGCIERCCNFSFPKTLCRCRCRGVSPGPVLCCVATRAVTGFTKVRSDTLPGCLLSLSALVNVFFCRVRSPVTACLQCVQPRALLPSDWGYHFKCALCGDGCEYFGLIPKSWDQVVFIALYNCQLATGQKYCRIKEEICRLIDKEFDTVSEEKKKKTQRTTHVRIR
jgi:hypothetical protein